MLENFADEDDYLYETSSDKERDFLKKRKFGLSKQIEILK